MKQDQRVSPSARVEVDGEDRDFSSGLLLDLIGALRRVSPGDIVGLTTSAAIGPDLEAWSLLTGHAVVGAARLAAATRWAVQKAQAATSEPPPPSSEAEAPEAPGLGARLWLYTNFDCNLACDYCCVRSTPRTPRRALGLERIARIAAEAPAIGTREIMLTGGEPFLLPDIAEIIEICARAAPTTVLTNAMRLSERRLEQLAEIDRERVVLQVSLDSPTPELHDRHRGRGSWSRAWQGAERARGLGFRVRFAATVPSEAEARAFERFLDDEGVAVADRVIRPVALRGSAEAGAIVPRAGLVPEMTITDSGVYWHPVGADDEDMRISDEIFPLARALARLEALRDAYLAHEGRVASVFRCA